MFSSASREAGVRGACTTATPICRVSGLSAVAASAYAGIPLTHRKYTSTVAFVTGHEDPEKASSRIDWQALATGIGTLVFFMGVKNLPKITAQLTAHGMAADTPVALIRWGTTNRQRTVTGTLATIVDIAREAGIKAPAIIPALGFRYRRVFAEANLGGLAVVTFNVGVRF